MQAAIGYLRVSKQEQGRRGLGLAAQRHDIEAFAVREAFSVKSWYQDVQTGAGSDALLLRPGLAQALKEAKSLRYPLMEHHVLFIVAAFGRDCDQFVLTR